MGIYPQANSWQCGPFALKYALLTLGIFVDEDAVARAAGSTEHGTDEADLARATRRFGCQFGMFRYHEPEAAREELAFHLGSGIPALLCIEQWNHWITAVKEEAGEFVLFDSRERSVVRVVPWDLLEEKWVYREPAHAGSGVFYDLHPVVPRKPHGARANFTRARALALRQRENRQLALAWATYGERLLAVASPRTEQFEFGVPFGEFIGQCKERLLGSVGALEADANRDATRLFLEQLRFVADTYDLLVRPDQEQGATTALWSLLGEWTGERTS
jgi:hypothetical protein